MRSRIAVLLAVVSFAASGAFAQTLYKSTMPDGRVIYGEKPVDGAKRVDTVKPPPPKSGITTVTADEKRRVEEQAKQRAVVNRDQNQLDDARKQLQQAEAAREAGKEPLPGERLGTAGGASRLTDAYHARQAGLEKAVQDARKRLDQTQGR
jgi:hypothetical protein